MVVLGDRVMSGGNRVVSGEESVLEGIGRHSPPPGAILVGVLRWVVVKHTFVVIAAHWPSWLVTLIALDLPIQGAYFPKVHRRYFKSKTSVCLWDSPAEVILATANKNIIYLVSGTVPFIQKLRTCFTDIVACRSIMSLEVHLRGYLRSVLNKARVAAKHLLQSMGLQMVDFVDNKCGGATDAVHWFGFGSGLGSRTIPRPEIGLPLCVRHFLDGGADLSLVRKHYVPRTTYQPEENPKRSVLWDGNILRPEGLLPCHNPNAATYCPAYESPGAWVVRALTLF